ncbi:MAG TPA: M56 family metallopeptidase [Bryobacteraceae bacterium]|nr:M56 family metallopeptidase [Bryobacteraceae bacterium]
MNHILAILEALMNSLWQAAIVAGLVWLALRFLPRGIAGFKAVEINAATRYAIWWAALAVVLVLPVAPTALRAMRPRPPTAALKAPVSPRLAPEPAPAVEPVIITVPPDRTARWPLAVLAVWAAILLFRLGQITRSYFYLRGVKRRAAVSPIALPSSARRAELLISRDVLSPMAVGFARPAVILPESLLAELSEPEREHVLLHEMAHLAGYDDWSNLAMRILGAALALHPVAVWILRRIEREREMVCDDWVVARTSDARPYAATLARLFEMRWARQKEALAPGLFGRGTCVGDRIEMLLRRGRTFSPRASGGGMAASGLALCALMLAGSLAPRWIAFAQEQHRPSFEVASVKPTPVARSGNEYGTYFRTLPGGRFSAENVPLLMLIARAYGVDRNQVSSGNWLRSDDRYDIESKANDQDPRLKAAEAAGRAAKQVLQAQMLQTLLEDRFKLAIHHETTVASGYALLVAKGGPKLKSATEVRPGDGSISAGKGRLSGQKAPLSMLAGHLSSLMERSVVDETGIQGAFDFNLEWTAEETPANPSSAPSIFTAIQEQLGLKLEARREQTETIVIDHVEKPDAN